MPLPRKEAATRVDPGDLSLSGSIGANGRWKNRGELAVVQSPASAPMILALARHILEHGIDGRFYPSVRKYDHEGGMVYWVMSATPEGAS